MKDPLGREISLAPDVIAHSYDEQMEQIIRALAVPMEWTEEDLYSVYLTDLSSFSDFCLTDEQLTQLSEVLAVPNFTHQTPLVDVAKQLFLKKAN